MTHRKISGQNDIALQTTELPPPEGSNIPEPELPVKFRHFSEAYHRLLEQGSVSLKDVEQFYRKECVTQDPSLLQDYLIVPYERLKARYAQSEVGVDLAAIDAPAAAVEALKVLVLDIFCKFSDCLGIFSNYFLGTTIQEHLPWPRS